MSNFNDEEIKEIMRELKIEFENDLIELDNAVTTADHRLKLKIEFENDLIELDNAVTTASSRREFFDLVLNPPLISALYNDEDTGAYSASTDKVSLIASGEQPVVSSQPVVVDRNGKGIRVGDDVLVHWANPGSKTPKAKILALTKNPTLKKDVVGFFVLARIEGYTNTEEVPSYILEVVNREEEQIVEPIAWGYDEITVAVIPKPWFLDIAKPQNIVVKAEDGYYTMDPDEVIQAEPEVPTFPLVAYTAKSGCE